MSLLLVMSLISVDNQNPHNYFPSFQIFIILLLEFFFPPKTNIELRLFFFLSINKHPIRKVRQFQEYGHQKQVKPYGLQVSLSLLGINLWFFPLSLQEFFLLGQVKVNFKQLSCNRKLPITKHLFRVAEQNLKSSKFDFNTKTSTIQNPLSKYLQT